jgi:hypothetical protein
MEERMEIEMIYFVFQRFTNHIILTLDSMCLTCYFQSGFYFNKITTDYIEFFFIIVRV